MTFSSTPTHAKSEELCEEWYCVAGKSRDKVVDELHMRVTYGPSDNQDGLSSCSRSNSGLEFEARE
eukprot:scaffold6701_cov146-Skeletonema_marinoi.AAC.2